VSEPTSDKPPPLDYAANAPVARPPLDYAGPRDHRDREPPDWWVLAAILGTFALLVGTLLLLLIVV